VTTIHPHDSDASGGKQTVPAAAPVDDATESEAETRAREAHAAHGQRVAAERALAATRTWTARATAWAGRAGQHVASTRLMRTHGLTLAGAALMVLIILNSALAYASVRALQAREQMVGHTHAVLGQMDDVLNALDEAESAQRGYIITGEESYLQPYHQASARIDADVRQLQALMADNGVEQGRIAALKPLIAAQMGELQRTIDMRRAGRTSDAEQEVASGESQRIMAQIRGLFDQMRATENGLLDKRAADARSALVGTTAAFFFATLTDVALLALVFALIRRVFAQRERVAAQRAELLATVEAQASQLEATFDALADGVVLYNAEAGIVRLNRATRDIFGLDALPGYETLPDAQRVPGLHLRDAQNRPITVDQIPPRRVMRGERLTGAVATDLYARTPDGREIVVSASGAPIRDEQGRIGGAVVVYRDVTERRRLEQRTSDALNALLAVGEILVQAPDEDGGAVAPMRSAAESDTGSEAGARREASPAASVAGQRLVALTRSVFGCQHAAIVALDPETDALYPVAIVGQSPADEHRWWSEVSGAVLDEYVDPASALRLRAGDPLVLDLDVSQRHAARTKYGAGRSRPRAQRTLVIPMRIGEMLMGLLTMEHGESQHVYTTSEVLLAQAVARLSALVIERERLLREREAAQSRALALTETTQRMDEFLGVASHELKTPVTSLKLNVQLAVRRLHALAAQGEREEDIDPAEMMRTLATVSRMLERSDRTMSRLTRLVDDLLDMSRIRADKLELRPELCDLVAIVRDAVQEQREVSPGHTITLSLPQSGLAPVVASVMADADRMGQVVTNYLTNALKYSKESEPVAVDVSIVGGPAPGSAPVVRVAVRDRGPGLPPEEQEAIWEPFHRARGIDVVSGSGVGLGLGLYISRTIVERHGGAVGLESAPGAGATFSFTLPLATSDIPTGGAPAAAAPAANPREAEAPDGAGHDADARDAEEPLARDSQ
jgi:signal transduction histidine kinase/CHASE3 domain sensor protein